MRAPRSVVFHATCVRKKQASRKAPVNHRHEGRTLGAIRSLALACGVSGTAVARDFASGSRSPGRRQGGPGRCEDGFVCVCRSLPRTTTHVNDPSAGSPTDTLLRLLRPLPQIICPTSQPNDHGQADHGTHPYRSLTGTIGRSDGRCVQRAGT